MLAAVTAVDFEGAEPIRMTGAIRDITERKEIELALKDAHRRKDEFLATLAHKLRNPLAPIRNAIEIMRLVGRDDPVTNEVRQILDRQVNQMVRLVDDLLDLSRISSGKIDLHLERLQITKVLDSALETSRPHIEGAHHRLIIESIPEKELYVRGDLLRLTEYFVSGDVLISSYQRHPH